MGTKLGEVSPVFPRADKSAIERMQQMEEQQQRRDAGLGEAKPEATAPTRGTVPQVAPVVPVTTAPAELMCLANLAARGLS